MLSKKSSKKSSKKFSKNSISRKTSKKNSKIHKEVFFMDIFNNILKYNDKEILIIFDKEGSIWFKLKDIIQILNYTSINKQLNLLKINKTNINQYLNINKAPHHIGVPSNFQKNTKFINENGLYELLTKSNKPLAKVFMNKYFTEIMPTIRKTGKYILGKEDKEQLDKLNNKLSNYKKELEYYSKKYNFEPSKNGYLYIKIKKMIINGKEVVCYKIGFTKNFSKRISVYKIGEFEQKFISIIPVNFDAKTLESCVKNKLKPHLHKLTTDTICFITLKELKNEISNCIENIKEHICSCILCKKKYNFSNIDNHSCYKNN